MKTITTYQLEAGDVLYYVHKPDDQYVVDEIVLDESNFVKDVIKHSISEKLSIKLPNKHDNSDFYYIRTNIEQQNQPLMLYTSIPTLSGVYASDVLNIRENDQLFCIKQIAEIAMQRLNRKLELELKIKPFISKLNHITITNGLTGRTIKTYVKPFFDADSVIRILNRIPQLEQENGPVIVTAILEDSSTINLNSYVKRTS